jgi:hypothetical protein
MTPLDRLLEDANPVPAPLPGRVTPDQERLLASIVDAPQRRRPPRAVRLLAVTSAVAAAALAAVLVVGEGANDEREAPTTPAGTGDVQMIHVVTRLYGEDYERGGRLDGWLEPATGRARVVTTTGGEIAMEQTVHPDDRVVTWQALDGDPDGFREDRVEPVVARRLRASVRDRMASTIRWLSGDGMPNAPEPTTESGEYRGRPVTIHRIGPPDIAGPDVPTTCCYLKWFTDADSGATIAYERGYVVDASGKDVVMIGEEVEQHETFAPGEAPLHELDPQAPAGG